MKQTVTSAKRSRARPAVIGERVRESAQAREVNNTTAIITSGTNSSSSNNNNNNNSTMNNNVNAPRVTDTQKPNLSAFFSFVSPWLCLACFSSPETNRRHYTVPPPPPTTTATNPCWENSPKRNTARHTTAHGTVRSSIARREKPFSGRSVSKTAPALLRVNLSTINAHKNSECQFTTETICLI